MRIAHPHRAKMSPKVQDFCLRSLIFALLRDHPYSNFLRIKPLYIAVKVISLVAISPFMMVPIGQSNPIDVLL